MIILTLSYLYLKYPKGMSVGVDELYLLFIGLLLAPIR